MKELKKVLEIEVPQGYEIDKENSTLEKIVFKKVEEKLTYEKITNKLFDNKIYYYINAFGDIKNTNSAYSICHTIIPHGAPTAQQLERLLAINKLMNVAYYLNDGWEPDWESYIEYKYFIYYENKIFKMGSNTSVNYGVVYFKSKELAKQAIEILGAKTIKLALGVI